MRYLYMAAALGLLGAGCATIPPELLQAQVRETEQWQRQYEAERERSDSLAMRLAEVEAALEAREQERADAEQALKLMREELERAHTERLVLEENNAQLRVQQRELTEMHEELSDVWFESALSRARRHRPVLPLLPAAEEPAVNEAGSEMDTGGTP